MLPLFTSRMPKDAEELERALNQTVARLFSGVSDAVSVRDESYPQLAEIRIRLDRAQVRPDPPKPPSVRGAAKPALQISELKIDAGEIGLGPATANVRLHAREVELSEGREANNDIILVLERAADGEIEVSASKAELENAIAMVARSQAGKQGVVIDQVQLTLRSRGERSLDGEVQLRAKKLFFSTTIRIAAKLDLDDELTARLSGLSCSGEGAIGAVACGVLQPYIEKMDGRSFPLLALPLGKIRLRDVRIATGEHIRITAAFGS